MGVLPNILKDMSGIFWPFLVVGICVLNWVCISVFVYVLVFVKLYLQLFFEKFEVLKCVCNLYEAIYRG